MKASRISIMVLFLSMTACDLEGCFTGNKYILIYRDTTPIQERGKIMKGEELIGFVDKTGTDKDGQRILMRLSLNATLHEQDRFISYQDLDGVIGLQIEHVGGPAVRPGATIYFPPLPPRPIASQGAPMPPALAASAPATPYDENYSPYEANTGLTEDDEVISFLEETYARRSIGRSLSLVREARGLPPEVDRKLLAILGDTKRPGTDQEVLRNAGAELPEVRKALGASARDALQRGDREAAKHALEAVQKIALLERRVEMLRQNPPGTPPQPELRKP